ncbi:hypothetical protein ACTXG7_11980 [Mycolicibacterium sp. Dal123E01]|uniref:hypothetical protein n=1 Tax=Mycolicibacterium sp. Dal123E01 TaxID=3457578 RepID=UPI00403E5BA9
MRTTFRLAAGVLAAGVGIAIAAAPAAAAAGDPHLVCTAVSDGNTACETPGNAQLTSSPPDVSYPSLYPFLIGDGLIFHNGPSHGMR